MVESQATVDVASLEPAGTDQRQQDIGAREVGRDCIRKILPRCQIVVIDEDPIGPESRAQAIVETPGVACAVLAPVADEQARHGLIRIAE